MYEGKIGTGEVPLSPGPVVSVPKYRTRISLPGLGGLQMAVQMSSDVLLSPPRYVPAFVNVKAFM